jgi:hypothetical protein
MLREQPFEKLYSLEMHCMAQGINQQLADAIIEGILSNSCRIELKGETIRSVRRGLRPEPQSGKEER